MPILGLCFGGQMLARVLGGEVYRGDECEIGWLPVRTNDPSLVPEGPWFQWHFDVITAPPGATSIAETDLGAQAFVAGRSLGLQFHPEVTPEIMDEWVRAYRHELDEEGVDPERSSTRRTPRPRSTSGRRGSCWTNISNDVGAGWPRTAGWASGPDDTALFPRFLDLEYPNVVRGEGVWLETDDGRRVIDASSGGAMVTASATRSPSWPPRPPSRPNGSRTSTTTTSRARPRNAWPTACSRWWRRRWRGFGSCRAARRP